MSGITSKTLAPNMRKNARSEHALRDKAMSGDMVMVIRPATVAQVAGVGAWTRTVTVSIKTAAGEVHDWLDKAIATTASIADNSALGTATIASTTLTLVNGVATIVVTGSAHAWVAAETDTLTIGNITLMGNTVTGGTSVGTFA